MERETLPASRRILLVDDDPVSLEILTLMLAAEGHRPVKALSGRQALAMLSAAGSAISDTRAPDFVLLDMQMPGLSGKDLARALRSLPQPHPRIIGMSATEPPGAVKTSLDGFLLKPVSLDELRSILLLETSPRPAVHKNGALDRSVLEKLRRILPPEAIREIYLTYVTDTRTRITELERCSRQRDAEGLRRCAHMIKGSAAMAGVTGIAEIASALETGMAPEENHGLLFHSLRAACDDVEQTIVREARG